MLSMCALSLSVASQWGTGMGGNAVNYSWNVHRSTLLLLLHFAFGGRAAMKRGALFQHFSNAIFKLSPPAPRC